MLLRLREGLLNRKRIRKMYRSSNGEIVEAFQYNGDILVDTPEWAISAYRAGYMCYSVVIGEDNEPFLVVHSNDEDVPVPVGYYIVCNGNKELSVISPNDFGLEYKEI